MHTKRRSNRYTQTVPFFETLCDANRASGTRMADSAMRVSRKTCQIRKGLKMKTETTKGAANCCDGNEAKLSDLKSGSTIRMTTCKDDKKKILAIDCGKHIPTVVPA